MTNKERGELALPSLQLFANGAYGLKTDQNLDDKESLEQCASDLIADIMHVLCDAGLNPFDSIKRAEYHFEIEKAEET